MPAKLVIIEDGFDDFLLFIGDYLKFHADVKVFRADILVTPYHVDRQGQAIGIDFG